MYPYILKADSVTVVIGTESYNIHKSHINYGPVVSAIKANDWDKVKDIIEPKKMVATFGQGNLAINGDVITWKGEVMSNGLTRRILAMIQEGFDITPLVAFMENLMKNPSRTAVEELYIFLDHCDLPITSDGHFLAYKKVNKDFKDIYSNTFDNSVGQVVKMDRNRVDDERRNECSYGLHFCSLAYLNKFGRPDDPIMILKINPANVVSIPTGYSNSKGRCCEYEVIGQLGVNPEEAFTTSVQDQANGPVPQADGHVPNYTWDDSDVQF